MEMKSVLAAVVAAAAISCTSACAFAEAPDASADEQPAVSGASEAADPMEGNPVSGVDGAAALAGIAMVAGAALVISHKHE